VTEREIKRTEASLKMLQRGIRMFHIPPKSIYRYRESAPSCACCYRGTRADLEFAWALSALRSPVSCPNHKCILRSFIDAATPIQDS
jgi:hypothetical protein